MAKTKKLFFLIAGLVACALSGLGIYDLVNGLLHAAEHESILGVAVFGLLLYIFIGILLIVFILGLIGILIGLFDWAKRKPTGLRKS